MSDICGPPESDTSLMVNPSNFTTTLAGRIASSQCLALIPCKIDAVLHQLKTNETARPAEL